MKRRAAGRALLLALLPPALLSGCAHPVAAPSAPSHSGRLLLRVGPADAPPLRSVAAGFEYQGNARAGRLALDGPLGARLAEARWGDTGVVLTDASGDRRYDSLSALAAELLGEPLPLQALGDWLLGQPWPEAPAEPTAVGFLQAGWQVDTHALADQGLLLATRDTPAPALLLRIVLDR